MGFLVLPNENISVLYISRFYCWLLCESLLNHDASIHRRYFVQVTVKICVNFICKSRMTCKKIGLSKSMALCWPRNMIIKTSLTNGPFTVFVYFNKHRLRYLRLMCCLHANFNIITPLCNPFLLRACEKKGKFSDIKKVGSSKALVSPPGK